MTTGDIYFLPQSLGEIPPGFYAIIEVGMLVTLSHLRENEDGHMATMWRHVKVTWQEIEQFVWLEAAVELLG